MPPDPSLELALRLLVSGLSLSLAVVFLLLAGLAARDASSTLSGRLLAGLCLCLGLMNVAASPLVRELLPPPVWLGCRVAGLPNVGLFWWFCLSLLHDDFRLRAWHGLGLAVLTVPTVVSLLAAMGQPVAIGSNAAAVVETLPFWAIAHVGWLAIRDLRIDLVAGRRRARVGLIAALLLAASISLITENLADPLLASVVRDGFTLVVALALLAWLTTLHGDRLSFEATPDQAASSGAPSTLVPRDLALHGALMTAMERDRLYLEHRLSISGLAKSLGAAEHRLRALINQGLGYRNFSAFLNGYRLQYAKELLGDPERARDTILHISQDSGFSSLQTFNRAFKDSEGIPPSLYRQQALARLLAGRSS